MDNSGMTTTTRKTPARSPNTPKGAKEILRLTAERGELSLAEMERTAELKSGRRNRTPKLRSKPGAALKKRTRSVSKAKRKASRHR
jgi:hypothetical protein